MEERGERGREGEIKRGRLEKRGRERWEQVKEEYRF